MLDTFHPPEGLLPLHAGPVDFVRSWYRGDRYEYAVTLSLNPASQAGPYIDLA